MAGPPMRPGVGTWLRNADSSELVGAAELSILACNASGEDLVRLAMALDMEATWGETDDGLRARVLWWARWRTRTRRVEAQPPVVLHWWAHVVGMAPAPLRPVLRRLIDGWRRRERP